MAFNFLNSKGQLSVEFIFILITMLLFVETIIQPNILEAEKISKEMFGLGYTALAAEKIVNAIDLVQASGGETRQTINIYVPENAKIKCYEFGPLVTPISDQNSIKFEYTLPSGNVSDKCPDGTGLPGTLCKKQLRPLTKAGITCGAGFTSTTEIGSIVKIIDAKAQLNIQVSKNSINPAAPVEIKVV
ncbi:MAG: hypothetical protein HYW50_02295 [Candidatus Diapherotrites archaeon]|nr:hypothetical protein [Candidatus Diapherotrites archaeon]